ERLTASVKEIDQHSSSLLHSSEATIIVQSTSSPSTKLSHIPTTVARLATAPEFAADLLLCKNRPPPIGYDEHRLRPNVGGSKSAVVRRDRFVFAACNTISELKQAVGRISPAVCI